MANENVPQVLASVLTVDGSEYTVTAFGPFTRDDEDVKGNWYEVRAHDNIREGTLRTIVPFDGDPSSDSLGFAIAMYEGMKRNIAVLGSDSRPLKS